MAVPVRLVASWDEFTFQPGEACWTQIVDSDHVHRCDWDNCDGWHLFVRLPLPADCLIDLCKRASNCGSPDDRLHRCWVIHKDDGNGRLHVDKNGHTCSAGAGSIAVDGWHGFLHHGELR